MKTKLHRSGIGLLELMLSLAIIAVLLVMATKFWGTTSRSRELNEATQNMAFLMGGLQTWKGAKSDYKNLSLTMLSQTGGLPDSISTNGALPSWDGCVGTLQISATNNNKQAIITFNNISTKVCSILATRFDKQSNGMVAANTAVAQCANGVARGGCGATFSVTVN